MPVVAPVLTTATYIKGTGAAGFECWPILPFWATVERLDERLLSLDGDATSAVRNAFIAQFVESAAAIARPALTSAMIARGVDWGSAESCWDAANSVKLRDALMDTHPVIAGRIERLAVVFGDSAEQLAARVWDPAVTELGEVTHIRVLGDVHLRGAVALLYIDERPGLVYKPRSLEVDALFDGILDLLRAETGSVAVPRHPRSIDRGDYGFQEYIKYSSPAPGPERASFYEQYGVLIALSYALKFQDLHYENIRATAQGPMVLDAECLLNFNEGFAAEPAPAARLLYAGHSNVFDSDILPNWRVTYKTAGPREVTSLGYYAHPDRFRVVRSVSIEDGAPRYVYERASEADAMPHHPAEELGVFPAQEYLSEILRGFDAAYEALLMPHVRDAILELANTAGQGRTRLVPADTAAYEALLQSNREPSTGARPDSSKLETALFDGEQFAIRHGVVPLIERQLGDGVLFLDNGTSVRTPGPSPLAGLGEQLRRLTQKDHSEQRIAVSLSLDLGAHNPSDGVVPTIALPATTALRNRIDALVDVITRSTFGEKAHPWAVTSREVETNYFSLQCTPPGLYAGMSGMAFALGIAGLDNAAARRAYGALQDSFLEALDVGPTREVSEFGAAAETTLTEQGYLGPLLSIAAVAEAAGDNQTLRTAAAIGRRWADAPSVPNGVDIIGGASGVALGLGRLYELTAEPSFRDNERRALASLIDAVRNRSAKGPLPAGMAHGLSGIAAAFHAAAGHLGEPDLLATAKLCLDLEDEMIRSGLHDGRADSWSWCWGAIGQLTARLACDPGSPRLNQLREATRAIDSRFYGICHGIAGAALLLNSNDYAEQFGRSDRSHAASYLDRLSLAVGSRARAPGFAPDPGLYTGTAGILVYLSAVRDDASFSIHDLRYEPWTH